MRWTPLPFLADSCSHTLPAFNPLRHTAANSKPWCPSHQLKHFLRLAFLGKRNLLWAAQSVPSHTYPSPPSITVADIHASHPRLRVNGLKQDLALFISASNKDINTAEVFRQSNFEHGTHNLTPFCLPNLYVYKNLVAQMVKNLRAMQIWAMTLWWREWLPTPVFLLGEWMRWTEEPGRLQFTGLQRVEHDWAINTFPFIYYTIFKI